ncbi:MAG: ornithine carbamoyltransferase [Spirochaetales bacterium]
MVQSNPNIAGSFIGRSLLTLRDYTEEEILTLLDTAYRVKAEKRRGERHRRLKGYSIALLFEKRSTRTRSAFETAFGEEGGHPVFLSPQDVHLGVKETVEDTARVLGRMFDCIQFRGYSHATVERLAEYAGIPVYNGLTDRFHPTQALADLMTLREQRGTLEGSVLTYVGDGRNNVATSLLVACARLGVSCRVASPRALQPSEETMNLVDTLTKTGAPRPQLFEDPQRAVKDADAVYTDVWTSMGEEEQLKERVKLLQPYQVNATLMNAAASDAIFLHCLPAVKGNEVTEEVFESSASRVFEQSENRKHTIKSVLLHTLGIV